MNSLHIHFAWVFAIHTNVHVHTFASTHIHPSIVNNIHTCIRLKYRSPKSLQHPTPSKKHGRWRACSPWCPFQEELESLKANVARLTSLLEQTFRNTSGEGPSNQPAIFVQPLATAQPERNNEWTWSITSIQSSICTLNATGTRPCSHRSIC
jgi:hypothetical protein